MLKPATSFVFFNRCVASDRRNGAGTRNKKSEYCAVAIVITLQLHYVGKVRHHDTGLGYCGVVGGFLSTHQARTVIRYPTPESPGHTCRYTCTWTVDGEARLVLRCTYLNVLKCDVTHPILVRYLVLGRKAGSRTSADPGCTYEYNVTSSAGTGGQAPPAARYAGTRHRQPCTRLVAGGWPQRGKVGRWRCDTCTRACN